MTLTPETYLRAKLAAVFVGAGSLVAGTAFVVGSVRDFAEAQRETNREVRAIRAEAWTVVDMDRWSRRLDYSNRDLGMTVPDPREIRQ